MAFSETQEYLLMLTVLLFGVALKVGTILVYGQVDWQDYLYIAIIGTGALYFGWKLSQARRGR